MQLIRAVRLLAVLCTLGAANHIKANGDARALVRHAPIVNGLVEGSLQQCLGENVTLNGGAVITGDLLVPGTPSVRLNGSPAFAGTLDDAGNTVPADYQVTLNGTASLRHVIRRTDAAELPMTPSPEPPTGTTDVTINSAGQAMNWATVRDATLTGNSGDYAVPAGRYGELTLHATTSVTLGVSGATEPSVYHFQRLTVNARSEMRVTGPVVVTVGEGLVAAGSIGAPGTPSWLTLQIHSGDLTLNGGVNVYGFVVAPVGRVTIDGNGQLVGGVMADNLTVKGGGVLRLISRSGNQAPQVRLTAPAEGSNFTAPASFTLTAVASDSDGSVAKVEFFQGTTLLGEDASAPYELALSGLTAGSYTFVARATDNLGATADSTAVTVTVTNPNQPPTVRLTAPIDGELHAAPASFVLSSDASDADGAVSRVEFYQGGTLLGADSTAPYEFPVNGLNAGTYTYRAVAYDDFAASMTSAAVTVTVVNPTQPPDVRLVAPPDGASFPAPASFTLVAEATDPDGTITLVEFFKDGAMLGSDTAAPYEFNVNALGAGSYSFVARAHDNQDSATDSAPVTITVTGVNQPPVVALTAPTDGVVVRAFTVLTLAARATDADGTITQVTFYQNGAPLADGVPVEENSYTHTIAGGLRPGLHTFKARAVDNGASSADSTSASVTVRAVLPYTADFESTEGYELGSLAGQLGWSVSQGNAIVTDRFSARGARSVSLDAGATPARIEQIFASETGQTVVFADFLAKPVADPDLTAASTFEAEGSRFAFLLGGGSAALHALNGDGVGGSVWEATAFAAPIAAGNQTQDWIRLTARVDLTLKTWDLYANGNMVAADLGFRDNSRDTFASFAAQGHTASATLVDDLFIGALNPLFADTNHNGIDDAWELAHGLSLDADNRNDDPDGDGVTTLQEYIQGTDPNAPPEPDSDGDGLSDAQEAALGTNKDFPDNPDVQLQVFTPAPRTTP